VIGLIINASSQRNRLDPGHPLRLASVTADCDRIAITSSLEELDEACMHLARAHTPLVAICGGDGTLHHTITALIRCYGDDPLPAIAILRGGGMNVIADSLGIDGEPIDLLRGLLRHRHRIVEHGLLRIGARYGFLFGCGAVYEFLRAYYASGAASPLEAARLLVRAVASTVVHGPFAEHLCRPIRVRAIADDDCWPTERFVAVCAATIEQVGFGFRLFRNCHDHPDELAVLGIDATPAELLYSLPRLRAGKPLRCHSIDHTARELVIEPIDPAVLGYTIDGDLYACADEVTIQRGPSIRIVKPFA
jgi:diacylglycerol kinase (ATP)